MRLFPRPRSRIRQELSVIDFGKLLFNLNMLQRTTQVWSYCCSTFIYETWNLNLCQFWKSIPVHLKFFSIKLFQFQQKSKTQETHVILSGQRKKEGYIRFARKMRKKQARKTKTILCTIIERDNSCICGYYK